MATSTNLEIPQITESQSNKATMVNTIMEAFEANLSGSYSLDTSSATTSGDDVTIPFEDDNDLSTRQALRMLYLVLSSGATADFNVIHPDNKHFFFCQNDTAHVATIKTAAGTGIDLAAGGSDILYCDGTNVISLAGSLSVSNITQAYDYEVSFFGTPSNAQVMAQYLVARETTFPADFADAVGTVGTNPGAAVTLSVKDDGVEIGTIDISTGGAFTFATDSNAAQTVAAGSVLTVENQATADGTIEDIQATLLATISVSQ